MSVNKPRLSYKILLIILLVLAGLFLARGTVRTLGVEAYADTFYKPAVNQHFDDSFLVVNDMLRTVGITFPAPKSDCSSDYYKGFHVTVYCSFGRDTTVKLTPEFVAKWQVQGPKIEQYLLSQGWQKSKETDYHTNDPIEKVLGTPQYVESQGAYYSINYGKTKCEIAMGYDVFIDHTYRASVYEDCERDVKFFGGFDY